MNIHLIAVGNKMPAWVNEAYHEYAKRLPNECCLHLSEIAPIKRSKGADIAQILRNEGKRMLAAIPKNALVIALEVEGKQWSTEKLSIQLAKWMEQGRDIALLVGGPEGLAEEARKTAEISWSLSPLTLPHTLVRVLLSEQIYRTWSLLHKHPYHKS